MTIESTDYLPSLKEQTNYWDERWERTQLPNAWQRRRGDTILELIKGLGLKSPKVLDMGCGTGWFTAQLAQLGPATGIDLSPHAIEIARARFPGVNYLSGNLLEIPLTTESFDVVVSQEVIAHVEDQTTYLARAAQVLKPNGFLIITTANKFVNARLDLGPDPPEHIKKWLNRRDLRRLLRPQFRVLRTLTILPLGNRGILRLVNSYKLNVVMKGIFTERGVQRFKEWAGLGWTLIMTAQKMV